MAKICSVCGAPLGEDPAILTIVGFGSQRCLCDKCSELIDKSLYSDEYDEIAEAADELAARLESRGCEDTVVLEELSEIFRQAKERAELIRSGEYDFSADESADGAEDAVEEVPEEYRETEEDRLLDEKEAEESKKYDKITTWACAAAFVVILVCFLLKFVFKVF